ncbi:MAG TPA: LacI family DNA-binding transcriptional regulator [Aggregatilineales bacterium]|nr:LacI family DNA-binding transcriptional regulator [Anaerolineales bacterium]HRE48687.1 LacI family DNA-binding transcriptional regulator [Aggregatilineales bacterium]
MPTPTLRDIAEQCNVSVITAYRILSRQDEADAATQNAVFTAAETLGYRLNVTIHDVAHAAGVSIATVSYVLNNSSPVSAETRERVLRAAKQLGYRPNSTARNLQASRTRLIGYPWHTVAPDDTNPVLDRFTYAMAQTAEAYGYHVLTFVQPADQVTRPFLELVQTNRVDGFIIADTNRDDPRVRWLMDMNVPFVAFGRANDDWQFPYVDVDGRQGVKAVVNHLLELGHKRIGAMGWPPGSLSGDERLEGYHLALAGAQISPHPDWIVHSENYTADAFAATQHLLRLPPPLRPTAIVCISDTLAIGVMKAIQAAGLSVGGDIAVTGFDDDPSGQHLTPTLTTLSQPVLEIASLIVERLIDHIEGRTSSLVDGLLLPPNLIIRESSGRQIQNSLV